MIKLQKTYCAIPVHALPWFLYGDEAGDYAENEICEMKQFEKSFEGRLVSGNPLRRGSELDKYFDPYPPFGKACEVVDCACSCLIDER